MPTPLALFDSACITALRAEFEAYMMSEWSLGATQFKRYPETQRYISDHMARMWELYLAGARSLSKYTR